METILMNIKSDINNRIESGEQSLLLRNVIESKKTLPFKVYTYESGENGRHSVVNEWICTSIKKIKEANVTDKQLAGLCMTRDELISITKDGKKDVYILTISDVIKYITPMPLTNFLEGSVKSLEEIRYDLCKEYCKKTNYGKKRFVSLPEGYVSCKDVHCKSAYDEYLKTYRITKAPAGHMTVKII